MRVHLILLFKFKYQVAKKVYRVWENVNTNNEYRWDWRWEYWYHV